MSYLREGLGDSVIDLVTQARCGPQATTAASSYDAGIADLENNTPFGPYYTPTQINTAVGAVMDMVNKAHNLVMQTRANYDTKTLADAELAFNDIGQRSLVYLDYVHQAMANNVDTLNSPDFRQWIIDAMKATKDGAYASAYASCAQPWWLAALQQYQFAFDSVVAMAKDIASKAAQVGQKILDIPKQTVDVVKYLFYLTAAAGGLYLAYQLFKKKKPTAS